MNNPETEKLILLVVDQRPTQLNQREYYTNNTWYGRLQSYSYKEIKE